MTRVLISLFSSMLKLPRQAWVPANLSFHSASSSTHGRSWNFGSKLYSSFRCYSSEKAVEEITGGVRNGWDFVGAKEYFEYRRSLYGEITHKALLVDAVGTLLIPSQPMAQIYRQFGEKYGVQYSEAEILNRYRWAYGQPWGMSRLRYVDDGRPFWQFIVTSSTGCSDSQYFEELYQYYTTEKARLFLSFHSSKAYYLCLWPFTCITPIKSYPSPSIPASIYMPRPKNRSVLGCITPITRYHVITRAIHKK